MDTYAASREDALSLIAEARRAYNAACDAAADATYVADAAIAVELQARAALEAAIAAFDLTCTGS